MVILSDELLAYCKCNESLTLGSNIVLYQPFDLHFVNFKIVLYT